MKPVERVHLELMSRLPVRTVRGTRKPADPCIWHSDRKPGRGDPEERLRLIRRVQAMRAAGAERVDIAEALNLCTSTVDRYIATDISTAAEKAAQRR